MNRASRRTAKRAEKQATKRSKSTNAFTFHGLANCQLDKITIHFNTEDTATVNERAYLMMVIQEEAKQAMQTYNAIGMYRWSVHVPSRVDLQYANSVSIAPHDVTRLVAKMIAV
jgi:hypothetical protein